MIDLDVEDEIGISVEGRVIGREFKPRVPFLWERALDGLDGQDVRITLARRKLRTPRANSYLWSAVYPFLLDGLRELALNAGEVCPFKDKKAVHRAMKHRFRDVLGTAVSVFLGEEFPDEPTTRVSGPRFHRYIEHLTLWAAERGISIPQPHEYGLTVPSGQDGEGE